MFILRNFTLILLFLLIITPAQGMDKRLQKRSPYLLTTQQSAKYSERAMRLVNQLTAKPANTNYLARATILLNHINATQLNSAAPQRSKCFQNITSLERENHWFNIPCFELYEYSFMSYK